MDLGDDKALCTRCAMRALRKVARATGLCIIDNTGGGGGVVGLRGESTKMTYALARILRSPMVVQATVASSEPIVWSDQGCTKRGVFLPRIHRRIAVQKTSDNEWVSSTTGDLLGAGDVPSVVRDRRCDVVAVVDLRACERRVMERLDGITAAMAERLPWDVARRVCALSLA